MYEDLEIAEVIGRGCSSFVLRARHIGTDKLLALKVRERKGHKTYNKNMTRAPQNCNIAVMELTRSAPVKSLDYRS